MKKRNNRIALALLLCAALCLCAGCKSELDGEVSDVNMGYMTVEEAAAYMPTMTQSGTLYITDATADNIGQLSGALTSLATNEPDIKAGLDLRLSTGLTFIRGWVFYKRTSLESVKIPSGVTSIGEWAFFGCTSLASVKIPSSVTSIGNSAFCQCSSLASVTIPGGVTSIENYAFSGCTSLTSVTIPGGVTSIGNYAFYGCSSLTTITFSGTTDAWKAITKNDYWNNNVPETTVVKCTDGDVGITE